MRVKLSQEATNLRYKLCPHRSEYDKVRDYWVPNLMFNIKSNHRSKIFNTDVNGLRYNDIKKNKKNSILVNSNKKNSLLIGSSVVFGIGASNDRNTISSLLSSNSETFLNFGNRAYNQFQEIIFFLTKFNQIKNISKIVIFSGMNDIFLFNNKHISNNFPGPVYWNNKYVNTMNNISNSDNSILEKLNLTFLKKKKTIRSNLITFDEVLSRNFFIWKLLAKSLNIKIIFILQPYLKWCKKFSKEEKKIIDYTKNQSDKYLYQKIDNSYLKYLKIYKKICKTSGIDFYDSNDYIKKNSTNKEFLFIDNVHLTDAGNKKISELIKKII